MDNLKDFFSKIGAQLLAIVVICIIAKLLVSAVSAFSTRVIKKNENTINNKRITTSMTMFRSASRYVVWFLAILGCISIIGGFNANNALLTAGVGTVVITLGAQNLFSDILSGMFLVFDRQYEVGDYVKIGEYEGVVKAISIRATYLEMGGRKMIIPNGQVKDVVNYDKFITCTVTVPVSYESDINKIKEILNGICDEYFETHQDQVLEKPRVLGIDAFGESSIDFKLFAKCYPMKHFSVPRQLREMIKIRFDEEGIVIPFSQVDVHITENKSSE